MAKPCERCKAMPPRITSGPWAAPRVASAKSWIRIIDESQGLAPVKWPCAVQAHHDVWTGHNQWATCAAKHASFTVTLGAATGVGTISANAPLLIGVAPRGRTAATITRYGDAIGPGDRHLVDPDGKQLKEFGFAFVTARRVDVDDAT